MKKIKLKFLFSVMLSTTTSQSIFVKKNYGKNIKITSRLFRTFRLEITFTVYIICE